MVGFYCNYLLCPYFFYRTKSSWRAGTCARVIVGTQYLWLFPSKCGMLLQQTHAVYENLGRKSSHRFWGQERIQPPQLLNNCYYPSPVLSSWEWLNTLGWKWTHSISFNSQNSCRCWVLLFISVLQMRKLRISSWPNYKAKRCWPDSKGHTSKHDMWFLVIRKEAILYEHMYKCCQAICEKKKKRPECPLF